MSQLRNHSRLDPEQTPFKKVLFALSCIPFVIPPAIWLLYMASRISPVKSKSKVKWRLYSLLTIAASVPFIFASWIMSAAPIAYIPTVLLVIYVNHNRVYEEYVMRYNALIDSGYYANKERTREADLHRWEKEIEREAKREAEKLTHNPKGEYVPRPESGKKNIPEENAGLKKEKKTETKSETQKQAEARVEEVFHTRPTEKHKEEKPSTRRRKLDF